MAQSNISLDGGEISILKALGFGGGDCAGETLMERVPDLAIAEVIDALSGMVMMGYVVSDRSSFNNSEEFKKTNFHVNSGYARELKDSLDPKDDKPKSRRVRRE
jgi:hypothetical protein